MKRDFRDLRGVHSAVQEDISTTQKVGSRKDALIQKRNQVRDAVKGTSVVGMGDKKRSFKDVDELISGIAKSMLEYYDLAFKLLTTSETMT